MMRARLLLSCALLPALLGCDQLPFAGNGADFDAAELCGGRAVPLHAIQGNATQSPRRGERVVVEAVVVLEAISTLGGVFLQDEQADRDGDLATSEGLFVSIDGPPPRLQIGDILRVEGQIEERGSRGNTLTTLGMLGSLRVCGRSETLPEPALLEQPPLAAGGWERYEGMRVMIEAPLTVIDQGLLFRRGQLVVAFGERQWQPTEIESPGEPARLLAARNEASRIVLDDASLAESPERLPYLDWPRANRPLRIGSTLATVSGVLDQREGQYRLYPEAPLQIDQAPRPAQPPKVPGRLRLASMNLLNYFNGDGQGGGFPTERGAQDRQELQRQRDKLLAAMVALDADLYAVQEVENDGFEPHSALPELATALDQRRGRRRDYDVIRPPSDRVGGDQITVGLIHDRKTLEAVGEAVLLLQPPFDQGRPALAQRMREIASGAEFTAVVVHFKSKGGCQDETGPDADQGDGQGCFNQQRSEAARVLTEWLASDPTGHGSDRQILLGDFNAYSREDPIRLLESAGYSRAGADEARYSFVFRGSAGSLDHALLSADLLPELHGFGIWQINADELVESDYRLAGRSRDAARLHQAGPYRSSDHDPLLLGLDLQAAPPAEPDPPADPAASP
jgi:predicted extracellular nuclease